MLAKTIFSDGFLGVVWQEARAIMAKINNAIFLILKFYFAFDHLDNWDHQDYQPLANE